MAKKITTTDLSTVDKLDVTFQTEDMNKLVEKINQIIEQINK